MQRRDRQLGKKGKASGDVTGAEIFPEKALGPTAGLRRLEKFSFKEKTTKIILLLKIFFAFEFIKNWKFLALNFVL